MNCLFSQVECKKAQPKEVMLPANLAKTRAAGRGAYGELLLVSQSPAAAGASSAPSTTGATYRYTPYPLPTPIAPSYIQFPTPATQAAALYNVTGAMQAAASFKRVMAATAAAAAAALRPPPTPTFTYSMTDLLGVQGLDMPTAAAAVYHPAIPAAIGL